MKRNICISAAVTLVHLACTANTEKTDETSDAWRRRRDASPPVGDAGTETEAGVDAGSNTPDAGASDASRSPDASEWPDAAPPPDGGLLLGNWSAYASGEIPTPVLEFEVPANAQEAGGVFASPVASDEFGNIYLSWMDPSATVKVARKDPSGQLTISVIETNSVIDQDHHNSSIGIDKYGYLHVVWGMHNSPWRYKVSRAPRDISTWDDIGPMSEGTSQNVRGLPGQDISYASFFKDKDRDLYVSFRHRVNTQGWDSGDESGGLARYSADATVANGRWRMLGGTNHPHATEPANQPWEGRTLLWTGLDGVIGDGAYQSYMIGHFADHGGRIHIAWAFDENNVQGWEVNHLGYAVSADKGETWSRANGQAITSLPMTDTNYDQVVGDPNNLWYQQPWVHVGSDGLPVVSALNNDETPQWWRPANSTWARSDIGQGGGPARVFADGYGRIYTFGWDALYYKPDVNAAWAQVPAVSSPWDVIPDSDYLFSTANVRYMDFVNSATKRVYTMRFSGHVWKAPATTCPSSLLFDGQAGGRNVSSTAGLVWDMDWRCEGGSIYVYSAGGQPSTRWTKPGVRGL
jgi:hypothetical protein